MWALYTVLLLLVSQGSIANLFINVLVREADSSLLVIHPDYCPESWLNQLLVNTSVSLVLQSLSAATNSGQHLPRGLHVICVKSMELPSEQQLQQLRRERSIFYVPAASPQTFVESLLRECYDRKILKVIALWAKDEQLFYYGYRPYPLFKLEQHVLDRRPFFLEQFPNMQRQPLIVLPDQKHPRTIVYRDWRKGTQVLGGSVGRFVNTLAWKLNATLKYPIEIKPGPSLHPTELLVLMEQLQVDVPAGNIPLVQAAQLFHTSYPFELSHICLMIPIAQPMPIRNIYLVLFRAQHILMALAFVSTFGLLLSLHRRLTGLATSWVDFVLNDVALRGLLGQSFSQYVQRSLCSRWLYLMLGLLGLNLSSIHEAALNTLLTHPPRYFQPRTFEDVQRAQLPLVLDIADLKILDSEPGELPLQVLSVNVTELNRQRDNMNQSNVYFASRLKWTLLSTQQKYFPREVFLYSMDACVSALTLMVFQLPQNSWFEEPISKLILDVRATGIFQHWVEMHFYDMAAAGLISFRDPIKRQPLRIGGSLRVEDLQWIGFAYGVLLLIASLIFGFEIIVKRVLLRGGKVQQGKGTSM